MSDNDKGGFTSLGDLISPKFVRQLKRRSTGPTPIQQRLIDTAALPRIEDRPDANYILYQHSVLCQTFFPYRNPGDAVREWGRVNGNVHLEVTAGKAMHPEQKRLVPVGLPFGPKCRLVLMHINQLALVTQSPHIEVADSLTAFVRRVLKLDPMGRNISMVKGQLARLSAADLTLGIAFPETAATGPAATTAHIHIVEKLDVWFPKDERQRVLWPSVIDLSLRYFDSLMEHAVPLDEAHIAALSHSGLALDIYAWLAQRLHRIPLGKPAFVSWAALYVQFGQGYDPKQMQHFRAAFRVALKQVLTVYKAANVTDEDARRRRPPALSIQGGKQVWREPPAKGLTLRHSPPPVPHRHLKPVS